MPTEREEVVTTEDIVAVLEAGAQDGSLQQQEYHLIGNLFELEGRTLPTVMTTRDSIVYFNINDDSETINNKILENPHHQFLVCDGQLDNLLGTIESKTILQQLLNGGKAELSLQALNKDLLYLPETLTLSDALNAFKSASTQFAVVVNEYALVVGVITLKDLMNCFMGDLVPYNDDQQIVKRDENSWLVDGATPIVDIKKLLEIDEFPDESYYETIAGFIIYKMKRMPKCGDYVLHAEFKFEAVDIDGIRVDQLLITRLETNALTTTLDNQLIS